MTNEIKVHVANYPDRKNLILWHTNPYTGKRKTRSAKTTRSKDAERAAERWRAELAKGSTARRLSWEDFRDRYEDEVMGGRKDTTARKVCGVFNSLELLAPVQWLHQLDASRLSQYEGKLRAKKRSEQTIKGHLAHIRSALNWAERVGLIDAAPKIRNPHRARNQKAMKGRPITTEEFERMLDKVPSLVGEDRAEAWRHYLTGLWLSGLRLAESLELWWDRDDRLSVDLTGELPMLRIPADLEKGNRDRLLPMAPECAELLLRTPEDARHGRVFNPSPKAPVRRTSHRSACGANCVGNRREGQGEGLYASSDGRSEIRHGA